MKSTAESAERRWGEANLLCVTVQLVQHTTRDPLLRTACRANTTSEDRLQRDESKGERFGQRKPTRLTTQKIIDE